MKKIDSTVIAKITSQTEMNRFVKSLGLKSKYLIIKPNWVQAREGTYTDARILDMFLTAVKKQVFLVESYTFWRTDRYVVGGQDYFSSKEATLKTGKKHWAHFKNQDQWFLSATGIDKVIKKHKAKYINITNEVWLGNVVDSQKIKDIVEADYEPVVCEELYSYIPQKLFELRGSDFVSLAKAKKELDYGFTLSTKNMFGLIPDPTRYPQYHGANDELLSQNIGDVNKIYRSLFNCIFVVDGVFTASKAKSMQEVMCIKNWGVILGGKNSIEVDALASELLQADTKKAEVYTLGISKNLFGGFSRKILSQIPKSWQWSAYGS